MDSNGGGYLRYRRRNDGLEYLILNGDRLFTKFINNFHFAKKIDLHTNKRFLSAKLHTLEHSWAIHLSGLEGVEHSVRYTLVRLESE
jgi:hypothetical protein